MGPESGSSASSTVLQLHKPSTPAIARRPLIDQCTNTWQTNSVGQESLASGADDEWVDSITFFLRRMWAVLKAPKFQRVAVVFVFVTILSYWCWHTFLSVLVTETRAAWNALNTENQATAGNVFGANKRVQLSGIKQLETLNSEHLPRSSKANVEGRSKYKRLIFIGDIHGCMDELGSLLKKAKYNPHNDHIITTGDMINKGPKSGEVIDFLREHGASAVRGNHEDRVLLAAKQISAAGANIQSQTGDGQDMQQESKAVRKSRQERELAQSLTSAQLDWLSARPLILRIGDFSKMGEVVVVHGGLVPGVDLENQDPFSVMNMRLINLTTHMPSHKHSQEGSIPWADFWNKYQKLLPAQRIIFGPWKSSPATKYTTVIYGHDSKRGLQINKYTKGLDSGCVNGKKLTAWILSDYGQEEVVQVKCGEH